MTSIRSRSQGRKSWSMIRCDARVAEPADHRPRLLGGPDDPALAALLEPVVATRILAEGREQRRLARPDLVVVPADEHAGHRRSRHLGRIAPDRPARVVELREDLLGPRGRGRREVELVRPASRDPEAARRSLTARDDPRPGGAVRPDRAARHVHRLRPEERVLHVDRVTLERPAVRLAPQPVQDGELVLEQVGTFVDRREGQPVLAMLEVVPAGPDADLDATAAHLVDGRHDLREVAEVPERDRRDQHAQPDPVGLAGQPGEDGPGIGGRHAGGSREARVVVGAEERLEAVGLGALGHGHLVAVGHALLGLDHQREAHRDSCMWDEPFRLTG